MNLGKPADTAVNQCVDLKQDESVVIVTDNPREEVADAIYREASKVTDDIVKIVYPVGEQQGEEPPTAVAQAMRSSDVFFAPTSKSITHTRAVSKAVQSGSRGSTLPSITEEAFCVGLSADYDVVHRNCQKLHKKVRGAEQMRFVSESGTDLTFEPRKWKLDTGDITDSGTYANLPSGEIFTAPKSVNGTIVYNGSIRPHGKLNHNVRVEVEDGYVTDVQDEGLRSLLESAEEEAGRSAYNLAEVAIGANPNISELTGNILLDEKAAGTVHIAIGDNINFGGEVEAPIHEDGVIENPRVYVDGEKISIPEAN